MNAQQLQQQLTPSNGSLTLAHNSLGKSFEDLLTICYDSKPIVFTQASSSASSGGEMVITGRSSFANVADLPVTARFSVDAAGEVHAELRYQLRDAMPGPAAWTFSRSFPKLPEVYDEDAQQDLPFLDGLALFDTSFIVTTHAGQDSVLGVPLWAGINFVSHLRPQGLLGVFEHIEASNPTLTLYGLIYLGRVTDQIVALRPQEHPWDRLGQMAQTPLPAGIYLQAALDLGFQAGKLSFKDTQVRIYTPLSTDWMDENPSFAPTQGYTGRLSIPSAGIELDLGCDMQRHIGQALLYGYCHGISVGKLAHLLDIAGSDGLGEHLPEVLKKPVEALEKLELMYVALDLVVDGELPVVRTAFATVGFPNLSWKVWKDELVVESLACQFVSFDPFRVLSSGGAKDSSAPAPLLRPRVEAVVTGVVDIEGASLYVSAGSADSFEVRARTLDAVQLPLDKVLHAHGPGIPSPSALTVNDLEVLIAPGKLYSMDLQLADEPNPWTIAVGKERLAISDVSLHVDRVATGETTGSFAGALAFDDEILLQVVYDVPGALLVRSTLPRIEFNRLVDKLCDQKVKLPSGFDFTLDWSSVVIQEQEGRFLFQLMTEVDGLGMLAFEASNLSGTSWGFALGVDLSASQPSKVPGLSALAALEKLLHLQRFMLVVSSLDQPGFQFPDAAEFNSPQLAARQVSLPGGSGGVSAGLNVFAEWNLDSSDKKQKLLKELLGLEGTLSVAIQVPPMPLNGTRMFIKRSGKIQGHLFQYELGVLLEDGLPGFFLTGEFTVSIHKQPVLFDVLTVFVETGALMSATMKGQASINCGPFKLSNLALEVGIDWIGIPSLGLAANIDTKDFASTVAVFFDSTDPLRSIVAGSVSDLTAKDVLHVLAGGPATPLDEVLKTVAIRGTHEFSLPGALAAALDGHECDKVAAAFAAAKVSIPSSSQQLLIVSRRKGASWHLTDLTQMRHYELDKQGDTIQGRISPQFYFAPLPTSIGTVTFPEAFYINAAIAFAGFDVEMTLDIAPSKGVSLQARMDKIVVVNEKLFSVRALKGDGGPEVSLSTFAQPENPVAEFRKPHFFINGGLEMLGVEVAGLYADVTLAGIDFELVGHLVPGVEFDLTARFGKSGLGANGKVKVGVGSVDLGPLGKAKVNTDVEVDVDVDVDSQQGAFIEMEAGFEFAGQHIHIGRFKLEAKPDTFKQLPGIISQKVEEALRDVFKDATKWADAVGKGAMEGVNDTAKVFKDVYGKSEKEAQELARGVGKGVNQAAKDVSKGVNQATKSTAKAVKKLKFW